MGLKWTESDCSEASRYPAIVRLMILNGHSTDFYRPLQGIDDGNSAKRYELVTTWIEICGLDVYASCRILFKLAEDRLYPL